MIFSPIKKRVLLVLLLILVELVVTIGQSSKPKLYLLAGQDSDYRLFKKYNFEKFDTTTIVYIKPQKCEKLASYARRLMAQMDTTQPFYLLGSSIGGMIACEMSKIKPPTKMLLLATAKNRQELPWRIRAQKYVPCYKIFSGKILKKFALRVQNTLEPEGRSETPTFKAMMADKDPDFMKRGVDMIIRWDNKVIPSNYIHIQGEIDHILPARKVKNAIILPRASHLLTITRSSELQVFLDKLLD